MSILPIDTPFVLLYLSKRLLQVVDSSCEYDYSHSPFMMFYHDGLRILDAEKARHSSKNRATPLIFTCCYVLISNVMLIFIVHAGFLP
jgi:hypothetical protein